MITKIPGVDVTFLVPVAINARGQITGFFNCGADCPAVFFRDVDGTLTPLTETFLEHGFKGGIPTGLSDEGDIAGVAFKLITDQNHAFIRSANGTLNLVAPPPFTPGGGSWALGIDRLGVNIIGYVNTPIFNPPDSFSETTQGFTQTATGLPKLFSVPFTLPIGGLTIGAGASGGINTHGAAVLAPNNGPSIYIAPDGTVSTIELGPCQNVAAKAINDNGWVTGSCSGEGFLWRK